MENKKTSTAKSAKSEAKNVKSVKDKKSISKQGYFKQSNFFNFKQESHC